MIYNIYIITNSNFTPPPSALICNYYAIFILHFVITELFVSLSEKLII